MGILPRLLGELARRLRIARNQQHWERELDEEMRFHIAMRAQRLADGGEPPDEAHLDANRRFGNITALRERGREAWIGPSIEAFVQDSRIAFRGMARNPGYAVLGAGTLAVAIAACTAVFTLAYAVLFRPLPYANADQLVLLYEDRTGQGFPRSDTSPANFRQLRSDSTSFRDMAMFHGSGANLAADGGETVRAEGARVTPNFFDVLGVRPVVGRAFRPEEEDDDVVILNYELWQRSFGGDRSLIGKTIRINERPTTVVGVLPPRFSFYFAEAEVWKPLAFDEPVWARRDLRYLHVVARLRDGVTRDMAQAELDTLNPRFREAAPVANREFKAVAVPVREDFTGPAQNRIVLLAGSVVLVLFIACLNVAHLMLSRSVRRASELAVRLSLGAGRGRLLRQLLTESLVLSFVGGVAGLVLAVWSLRVLQFLIPDSIASFTSVEAGWETAAVALGLSVVATLVSGLLPALRLAGMNWHHAIKQGSSRVVGGFGQERLRGVLVMSEVALAVLLVVGASLMIRTLSEVLRVDAGFQPEGVLTAITHPGRAAETFEARLNYIDSAIARLRTIPGVKDVAFMSAVPFTWKGGKLGFAVDGTLADPDRAALNRQVTAGYFRTLGIPVRAGRTFTADDRADTRLVAVVNETLVRKYFSGEQPLGRTIRISGGGFENAPITIVGIAGDVKEMGLLRPAQPMIYVPHSQTRADFNVPFQMAIRTEGDPTSIIAAVRAELNAGWRGMPVSRLRPLTEMYEKEMADRRPMATLAAGLAGVALVLACVGIYGLLAFSVAQRLQEIGIRQALGAAPWHLLRDILGRGLTLSIAGIAVGVAISLVIVQLIRGVLYGVSPLDPATFVIAPVVVLLVAIAASVLPTRSALRVDPAQALRAE